METRLSSPKDKHTSFWATSELGSYEIMRFQKNSEMSRSDGTQKVNFDSCATKLQKNQL